MEMWFELISYPAVKVMDGFGWICKMPLEMSSLTKSKAQSWKLQNITNEQDHSYPFIQNDNKFCPKAKEYDFYLALLPLGYF